MGKYAIILNTEDNSFINKIIDDINKRLNIESILPPHCTVFVFEANDEIVKKFRAIEVKSIVLKCLEISTFEGYNNTIYIEIEKNKELLEVYEYYLHYLKDIELDKYSLLENYIPHITLATHLTKEQLEMAKEECQGQIIPSVIKVMSIAIVNDEFKMTKRRTK